MRSPAAMPYPRSVVKAVLPFCTFPYKLLLKVIISILNIFPISPPSTLSLLITSMVDFQVRFIVMGNMFCTELRIHRRFDLKGSSQGRSADKVEIDENTTLKDLDLDFVFRLDPSWREALFK